jgi:hypothetical protein
MIVGGFMGIMRDTDKMVDVYMSMMLMWADKNPAFFIHCIDNMEGGLKDRKFLTTEQQDELQAKYDELKG